MRVASFVISAPTDRKGSGQIHLNLHPPKTREFQNVKKLLLSAALAAASMMSVSAQVTNYALQFDNTGTVDCGEMPELDARDSYIIQFWFKPTQWTEGATVMSRGDQFRVSMGKEGNLLFKVGDYAAQATGIPADQWSLVSLRRSASGNIFINGKRKSGESAPFPTSAKDDRFILGGGFQGMLDEVRVWGTDITDRFGYFEHTTLNKWCPDWNDLIAYFKMDQELCGNVVDYRSLWSPRNAWNHHGVISEKGVTRVKAENPDLPYLINSAYTANERFYDRAIPREQYLLANDLIILGVESLPSGHVRTCTPNNHATINGGQWMSEFEGRQGVMSFDGNATLDCGTDFMRNSSAYTFETWIYVEEWVPGAYIVRKETDDASKGFSIRLGEESSHEIIVRVNGKNFSNIRQMKAGQWIHLAVAINGGDTPGQTFCWIYDGKRVGYGSSKCDDSTDWKPAGNEDCHAIIGEGFKGKLDEFAMWDRSINRSDFVNHMNGLPMPSIGGEVTSDIMQSANTYLRFDEEENPGWSSHSQDQWKRIMEAAYDGYRGYTIRISVKSHNGWESTIVDSNKRKLFAADLARISENYDGVELDLEWIYGTQTYLGLLAKDIREALPEGKTLMVSCHNVAYRFPTGNMQYCDGFTFQQYGPQREHSYYSHFTGMTQSFINYGFPKEKILCSYATTTSRGYRNGSMSSPIKGVKDGFMEGDFVPSEEVDFGDSEGETFYFDGPLQTYMRAKYVTDNRLGGIFYWDMGNDSRPEHPYNLAKWCGYGLNANVDSLVTNVDVRHFAEVTSVEEIRNEIARSGVTVSIDGDRLTAACADGTPCLGIDIADLDGRTVVTTLLDNGTADIRSLARGVYIARITRADGRREALKFVRR